MAPSTIISSWAIRPLQYVSLKTKFKTIFSDQNFLVSIYPKIPDIILGIYFTRRGKSILSRSYFHLRMTSLIFFITVFEIRTSVRALPSYSKEFIDLIPSLNFFFRREFFFLLLHSFDVEIDFIFKQISDPKKEVNDRRIFIFMWKNETEKYEEAVSRVSFFFFLFKYLCISYRLYDPKMKVFLSLHRRVRPFQIKGSSVINILRVQSTKGEAKKVRNLVLLEKNLRTF